MNNLNPENKKNLLGNIVYNRVKKFVSDESLIPKITGMLIDIEVLEISEIIEIIESDKVLQDRIEEAVSVINETNE